jgi:riboflavin kinase / FMN adenylyltransferase
VLVHRDDDEVVFDQPSALAIGVFDGVHRGHVALLNELVARARDRNLVPTVITFDPHPALTLAPTHPISLLQTLAQRVEFLSAAGVEQVRVISFNERLAEEAAEEFVKRVVVGECHAQLVVVGEDFRFGHQREGSVELLRTLGDSYGFESVAFDIQGSSQRWSSTAVRRALADGDLVVAADVLGRPFTLSGIVVSGDRRGRELGYPTANMEVGEHQAIPAIGIYAGAAQLANRSWHAAAISVGTRPQFYDNGALLVEVHLPGFSGDLYGQRLDVTFLERLRGEMTFSSVEELMVQMGQDTARSIEIFGNFPAS